MCAEQEIYYIHLKVNTNKMKAFEKSIFNSLTFLAPCVCDNRPVIGLFVSKYDEIYHLIQTKFDYMKSEIIVCGLGGRSPISSWRRHLIMEILVKVFLKYQGCSLSFSFFLFLIYLSQVVDCSVKEVGEHTEWC